MGLDQYLKKKTFVGAYYDHRDVKGNVEITINGKPLPINFKRISCIEEQVGYWRKANHIHEWFVQNIQKGEDDCREYHVSVSKFKKLLEDCKKAKESIVDAPEVLPTKEGFFFGSTDYDEGYWQDIEDTILIIEEILKEEEEGEGTAADYYYQSSW